ncbi:glucose-6-phosphate dehydrogenase assembly protein OpcA [Wenjunlia tyrosinilytica]|uniref:Glucose-6-phosphate dehydrogenase assembly protein OpcA n=1 Tax=Wenjunlia tyrosinilytica TaxID=1544741 RepID=A0A917ZE96_9ACTN|nr:glucose-6-phosphate dehydrogenase assembly protein OpcA [Wenjunlia tyrosinilytica]GGO81426.1 glucose-6-phosphate dehydrogenase assembly protein OpcA [Wenjunlia tyrosinilytica]
MNIDLTHTTSSQINNALVKARRAIGSPAVGMVLTLVIVTDEGNHYDALKAANEASREHPSRILAVIKRHGRSPRARAEARLDAEVRIGEESGAGEIVLLRLHGELANHAESVVLPLLLPDAPVVVWWPEDAPERPAEDPLGALAQRRVTDAAATENPMAALIGRGESYTPGDTDLAWTRITPWRSMLAAALDQKHSKVTGAVVEGEAYNPSSELLALWLADRLKVEVELVVSQGPGLTGVRLRTADGDICLDRADGALAELAMPGQPDRHVALKRRGTSELIAEELRRLDPDEVYASTVRYGLGRLPETNGSSGHVIQPQRTTRKAAATRSSAPASTAPASTASSETASEAAEPADGTAAESAEPTAKPSRASDKPSAQESAKPAASRRRTTK